MISKRTIEQIYDHAVIEEVVGDFVSLKRAGKNYRALSPFTNEKTPSFYVVPTKGIYKCFSSGKGGNVVNFLMEHEKISYPEALRWLARKYQIEIEEDQPTEEEKQAFSERESLGIVVNYATDYFKDQLWNSEEGKAVAYSYLAQRGFRDKTIQDFDIGWCPDQWDAFTRDALEKGYQLEYLQKAGLTKERNGSPYDFFRARVIFPIHDISGKVLGFGARTLRSDKKVAKYFNSPESELYNKSRVLYGMYQAKSEILKEDVCYLVEGYTDVIALHQAGVSNVVSSSGTALTEGQIRIVKRFTKNITILYDGDPAGIRASLRGIDLILSAGMNVKVVLFPDGEDPDSYSQKVSSEEFGQYLKDKAKDFIVFKTDLLTEDAKDDPIKRAGLIREIVESIALIPDAIQRSVYMQECSRLLEVPEQTLLFEINKSLRKRLKKKSGTAVYDPPIQAPPIPEEVFEQKKSVDLTAQEEDLVRILLKFGDCAISMIAEKEEEIAAEAELSTDEDELELSVAEYLISELDFDGIVLESTTLEKVVHEYRSHLDDHSFPSNTHFIHHDDPEVCKVTANLLMDPYELSENWKFKHGVLTELEEHDLKTTAKKCIHRLKLFILKRMKEEAQEELNKSDLSDEHMRLTLQKIKVLDSAKMEVASFSNTTIV